MGMAGRDASVSGPDGEFGAADVPIVSGLETAAYFISSGCLRLQT